MFPSHDRAVRGSVAYTISGATAVMLDTPNRYIYERQMHGEESRNNYTGGAGAIPLTAKHVSLVTTGADALTLADGYDGQDLYIVMVTDGGDGTLTPSNFQDGTTITFDDVGDDAMLKFLSGNWHFVAGSATVA